MVQYLRRFLEIHIQSVSLSRRCLGRFVSVGTYRRSERSLLLGHHGSDRSPLSTKTARAFRPRTKLHLAHTAKVSFHSSIAGLILLIALCLSRTAAQTEQIDSLKRVLPETAGKERLAVLYALANQLEGINPQQGLKFALEGISLAAAFKDTISEATLNSSAAFSSSELGDAKQAMQYGYRALELGTLIGDKNRIASAHSTIGIALAYIGQFSKALQHHFEALRLREELGLNKRMAGTLNNIGIVYHRIGHYDDAIEYYKRSLDRQGPEIGPMSKAKLLANIGYSEYKRGNFDAAMRLLFEARVLAEKSQSTSLLAYIYYNLGIMLADKQNTTASLEYLNRAYQYYNNLGMKNGMVQTLNALGSAHYKLGNLVQSRNYLEQAVALGKQINAPDQIKMSYETLYLTYEKTGPAKLAHQYLKLYSDAKDSMYSSVESKEIANLSIQNALMTQQNEIELLKREQTITGLNLEKQKYRTNLIIGVSVLLVAVIALMYFNIRTARKAKRLLEHANASLNELNVELQQKIGEVRTLTGLLPMCAWCKKIRDDAGDYHQIERYIATHTDARLTHGICPDCAKKFTDDMGG